MARWLTGTLLGLFALGAVVWFSGAQQPAFGQGKPQAKSGRKSPSKDTVTISECRISLLEIRTLAAGRSGILAFVEPGEGDTVEKNQHVAGLKDGIAQAQHDLAKRQAENDVDVRYSVEAHSYAKLELEQTKKVNAEVRNAFGDLDVEKLELDVKRGALSVEQAKFQQEINRFKVTEAMEALKTYQVVTPIGGLVTKVHKKEGEAVREGEPILEITRTNRVKVDGYISFEDVLRVKQGDPVSVQLDVADVDLKEEKLVFPGRLKFVDVRADPVTNEFHVWAEVENPDNILRGGLSARMTIVPSKNEVAKRK